MFCLELPQRVFGSFLGRIDSVKRLMGNVWLSEVQLCNRKKERFTVESSHCFSKASAQPQIQWTVKKPFQWRSFNWPFSLTYCRNWLHASAKQLLYLLYQHLYFCCQCEQLGYYLHSLQTTALVLACLSSLKPIIYQLLHPQLWGCLLLGFLQQQLLTAWPRSLFQSGPLMFTQHRCFLRELICFAT